MSHQIGLFGQTIIEPLTGAQLPLFHEPVEMKPPPADATTRKWAAAAPATPSMFAPATTPTESPGKPAPQAPGREKIPFSSAVAQPPLPTGFR